MRKVRYRRTPALSDPFLREAESLFEKILSGNGDVPNADFLVAYALDVCEYRSIVLEGRSDNVDALLKAMDLKEGVAEKLEISSETLKGIAKMISNKDIGSLQGFYEQLIEFTKKKGERGEK